MTKSADVRKKLGHPVIDADGHMIEFEPAFIDTLKAVGGADIAARCTKAVSGQLQRWYELTPEARRDTRALRPPWGLHTKNTLDVATAMLPKLFHQRLPDFGIDYAIVYPTLGMVYARQNNDELRQVVCRAINTFFAEQFKPYGDRITPTAIIPTRTPKEAIEEVEYAVKTLGLKTIVIDNAVRRPIAGLKRLVPDAPPEVAAHLTWLDSYGVDSAYDYDPFWQKCIDLGVAPTGHQAGHWGTRTSISNYMHNHLGLFASAGEALCKSLFMSGVSRRFPSLRVGVMEGGVAWACSLYSNLIEHWKKRNLKQIGDYDPVHLDEDKLRALFREYGQRPLQGSMAEACPAVWSLAGWMPQAQELMDEWAACKIERAEDIAELFIPSFYFGCEGDDPTVAWAFHAKVNPFGVKLKAFLGSDIGHWDVPDMTGVLEEAYELVEHELVSESDFRDFVFVNAVDLHTGNNPHFFKGTVVEHEVDALLRSRQPG